MPLYYRHFNGGLKSAHRVTEKGIVLRCRRQKAGLEQRPPQRPGFRQSAAGCPLPHQRLTQASGDLEIFEQLPGPVLVVLSEGPGEVGAQLPLRP